MKTILKTIRIGGALIILVTLLSIVGAAFGEVTYNGKEYICLVGDPNPANFSICQLVGTNYTSNATGLNLTNTGITFPGAAQLIADSVGHASLCGISGGIDQVACALSIAEAAAAPVITVIGGSNCAGWDCKGSDLIIRYLDDPSAQIASRGEIAWSKANLVPPVIGSAGPNNRDAEERCAVGELVHLSIAWDGDIHADLGPVDSPSIINLTNDHNRRADLLSTPGLVVEIPLRDRYMFPNLRDLRGHQTLRICGRWVTDTNSGEGWNELHPVTFLTIITPPIVDAGSDATINEGSAFSNPGSFTDPGSDTWTATVDYGDGTGVQSLVLSGKTFSLNHVYADNGAYTVNVTVNDGNFGDGWDTAIVTVNNVAPTVNAGPDATINEGSAFSSSGSFTDPGNDTWTATVDYGDGGAVQPLTLSGKNFSLNHVYAENGTYIVNITVKDDDLSEGSDNATVTVNNVAPTVGPITAPIDPLSVSALVTASATFTDPGTMDTHIADWNWGDGATSPGTVTETPGYVTGNHTYAAAGIYTVTLTVTDDDGGAGSAAYMYVVIYDPTGGFVTGGGWINSPEDAYMTDPMLTGRANFGFVSKYQKGAQVPTGVTEFQFSVANLNFHSKTYEWLVIAGASAKFKGSGTINGAGNYGFMLTAVDGAISGGGGADKFRIMIWDKNDGDKMIYDNKPGTSITGNEATVLGGGSIIIHQ